MAFLMGGDSRPSTRLSSPLASTNKPQACAANNRRCAEPVGSKRQASVSPTRSTDVRCGEGRPSSASTCVISCFTLGNAARSWRSTSAGLSPGTGGKGGSWMGPGASVMKERFVVTPATVTGSSGAVMR